MCDVFFVCVLLCAVCECCVFCVFVSQTSFPASPQAIEVFGIMSEKDDVTPTAREYRSMLHMLSLSKDVPRGANWARSVELLKEAQELEYRLTEVSFRTGKK